MKSFFIHILFVFSSLLGWTQELPMTVHFNANNGLKQNSVFAIEEDIYGRIWIGTSGGLQYYTGYEIVNFSAIEEKIMKLYKKDSALYCITLSGIYKIDFLSLETTKFGYETMDYSYPNFKKDCIEIVIFNSQSKITLDYDLNKQSAIKQNYVVSREKYRLEYGGYELISDDKGLYYIDDDTISIVNSLSIGYTKINNNKVFFSTVEGLIEVNVIDSVFDKNVYFPKTRIECSMLDRNNNLWVGTAENGIFMIHRNILCSTYYPILFPNGDPVAAWGIFEIEGDLYSGSSNGIVKLDNDPRENKYEKIAGNKTYFSGISNDEMVLLGSSLEGVFKLKQGKLTQVYFNEDDALDCLILQIISNEEGFLACSKKSFIQLDHQGNFMFSKKYDFSSESNYVMEIRKVNEGYMIATTDGIYILDLTLNVLKKYKSDLGRVFSMTKKYQNEIWMVSTDNGLFKIEEDSLLSIPVDYQQMFSMANVENNELWLGAYSGLYQYNDTMYRPYEFENGFPIREYNQNGFFQNDNLYYGGLGGVFKFNVDSVQFIPEFPEILVKRKDEYIDVNKSIILNYDQSEVVFTLVPIMQADKNLFTIDYKLKNDWKEISSTIQIVESVEWGDNNLIIRVKNNVTNEERYSEVIIHREEPFWKSLWFKVALIFVSFLLIVGIYSFVKFLQTRIMLRKEQAHKRITEERLRISNELHDNIGSRLTHIISSLDIELFQKKENTTSIENINSFARETMTQLRETIWAVSEKAVFFSEFANRVEQYIDQVDNMTKINITFFKDEISDFELNPVQTINFYRIIQEAINNAIKYSSANDIAIRLTNLNDEIEITIQDNGVGFDTNKPWNGTGLNGMLKRAKEAKGEVEIESINGVLIKLTIKKTNFLN